MKRELQIIFAGVGGQGLILAGGILGEAVALHAGEYAAMTSSYGVETRGSFTKSDLIISGEDIDYPEVERPDVVVALAQVAYDRYAGVLEEGVSLVFDSSSVTPKESKAKQVALPMGEAAERLGAAGSVNLLSVGVLVGLLDAAQPEHVEAAIAERFGARQKALERNLAVFLEGVRLGAGAKS